jgi:hypothetical protein
MGANAGSLGTQLNEGTDLQSDGYDAVNAEKT